MRKWLRYSDTHPLASPHTLSLPLRGKWPGGRSLKRTHVAWLALKPKDGAVVSSLKNSEKTCDADLMVMALLPCVSSVSLLWSLMLSSQIARWVANPKRWELLVAQA